ncbi:cytochrome P450 2B2-like [Gastrophryne carolinensis]
MTTGSLSAWLVAKHITVKLLAIEADKLFPGALEGSRKSLDMSEALTLLLVLLVSSVLYLGAKTFWKHGNLPPGPMALPLLGNFMHIGGGDIVNSLLKLRKRYGDVFTVYFGSRPVVVVSGCEFVKEVYLDKGEDYLNRGGLPIWDAFYRNYGFVYTNNIEWWRNIRQFSLTTLRGFGMGKKSNEDFIIEEAQSLVKALHENKG